MLIISQAAQSEICSLLPSFDCKLLFKRQLSVSKDCISSHLSESIKIDRWRMWDMRKRMRIIVQ